MNKKAAFTLIELLIAMMVSSILIGITISTYNLFRKSTNLDQSRSNLDQNNRIALDRLTRELRQTPDIVTVYPADATDVSVPQPGEVEFEDGHANDLTYKRYYIVGTTLKVDVKEYYFSYDTTYRVKWNAIGNGGISPISSVLSTQDIADTVQSLNIVGSNVVTVTLTTADQNNQQFVLRTAIFGRNL